MFELAPICAKSQERERDGPPALTDAPRSDATERALHDMVRRAAAEWDDAVGDHTGSFPIAVESPDDLDDDAQEDEDDDLDAAEFVSVVSR